MGYDRLPLTGILAGFIALAPHANAVDPNEAVQPVVSPLEQDADFHPWVVPKFFGREELIPNGDKNQCYNCHRFGGGSLITSFGEDYITFNRVWSPSLAGVDSDGDGFTNGQELQDPQGSWLPGRAPPGDYDLVSNPGDPHSTPGHEPPLDNPRVDGDYRLEPLSDLVFDRPTGVMAAHGLLYVTEQRGTIWILENGEKSDEPFLIIPDSKIKTVGPWGIGELGISSIIFRNDDPEIFYLTIAVKEGVYNLPSGSVVIEEYHTEPGNPYRADANSARLILFVLRPPDSVYAQHGYGAGDDPPNGRDPGIHNGGDMHWGVGPEENVLYVSFGDAGTYCDRGGLSQDLTRLWGSIIRIVPNTDPLMARYGIPPDNPFVQDPSRRSEIIAYGLRNPYCISLQPLTGRLFIGDSGQGRTEEINLIEPLQWQAGIVPQFGWPILEGSECLNNAFGPFGTDFTPLPTCDPIPNSISAIHQYFHSWIDGQDRGYSISGILAYTGMLEELQGSVLFADYSSGRIAALSETSPGQWERREILKASEVLDPVLETPTEFYISHLEADRFGEPLVVFYTRGQIAKIAWDPIGVKDYHLYDKEIR